MQGMSNTRLTLQLQTIRHGLYSLVQRHLSLIKTIAYVNLMDDATKSQCMAYDCVTFINFFDR